MSENKLTHRLQVLSMSLGAFVFSRSDSWLVLKWLLF